VIRVLLADDHGVVREGLSRLLSTADGIEVLPLARDGEEAVAIAAEHEPDVVLMDLSMPRLDGAEATRRILATNPEVQVVILTSFSDREQILGALSAGAIGYLLKDAEPGDLIEGVHAAARGESPLHPKAAREVLNLRESAAPSEELTARELEVLGLLAEGLPNKRISMRLGISEKTVKAHVTSIFNRIGVTDRTQAALWARDHGIG
jgi:DNA-binding NarL/FixJ family response regulator